MTIPKQIKMDYSKRLVVSRSCINVIAHLLSANIGQKKYPFCNTAQGQNTLAIMTCPVYYF